MQDTIIVNPKDGPSSSEEEATATPETSSNRNTDASDNGNNIKRERKNRPRRQAPESQAKRRMEAMTTNIDHKLAAAFTAILVLYTIITLGIWKSLEAQTYRAEVIELTNFESNNNKHIEPNSQNINDNDNNNNVKAEDFTDIETLQHTFPVHASDDTEIIDHPGMFLANPDAMKKIIQQHPDTLPADGKISVPKFWRPNAYGPDGVREFLGNYGDKLLTPDQADQIGSFAGKDGSLKTVYISVASYRDPECQPTVEDMFLRAEYPERLRVAVVEQRVKDEDDETVPNCGQPLKPCSEDPEQMMCKYGNQIDVFVVPAILSVGPVFARHLANRMYRGEYFAMQVDSHVRFIEHWDTNLISQWESANNEMGVITTYLSDIINSIDPITFENKHPNRPIMCKTDYEGKGKLKHLRHGQQPEGLPGIHGEPTLHPFWA
ncbi:MAG: hypothetical protein ACI90V_000796 [Bacillariaceae sp.]|jgi:hypothetical protein